MSYPVRYWIAWQLNNLARLLCRIHLYRPGLWLANHCLDIIPNKLDMIPNKRDPWVPTNTYGHLLKITTTWTHDDIMEDIEIGERASLEMSHELFASKWEEWRASRE